MFASDVPISPELRRVLDVKSGLRLLQLDQRQTFILQGRRILSYLLIRIRCAPLSTVIRASSGKRPQNVELMVRPPA
jgi:hypothetical protein